MAILGRWALGTSALGEAAAPATTRVGAQVASAWSVLADLPGWTQTFFTDFDTDVPLGSWPAADPDADWFDTYEPPLTDTEGHGNYDSARTISVSGGALRVRLHTDAGVSYVGAPVVRAAAGQGWSGQTYGRYECRMRAVHVAGANDASYKVAFLLWPTSDIWPDQGEFDWPEGNLAAGSTPYAAHIYADPTYASERFDVPATVDLADWHTYTIEWTPTAVQYFCDGLLVGTSTRFVPQDPMRWVLQCETNIDSVPPDAGVEDRVEIDWISQYSRSDAQAAPVTTESWTGADGAPWPQYYWHVNPGGAVVDIQGNAGRIAAVAQWGSSALAYLQGMAPMVDVDVTFDYTPINLADQWDYVGVRSPNQVSAGVHPAAGYYLGVYPHLGVLNIGRWATSETTLSGDVSVGAFAAGVTRRLRFQVIGNALKAKIWAPGDAEPDTWAWEGTDSTHAGVHGRVHVVGWKGATGSSSIDNLSITQAAPLTRVQATQDLAWSTRTRLSQTLASSWSARTRVGAQAATAWAVRSRVAKSATAAWSVSQRTQAATLASAWSLRQRVAQTRAASWSLRQRIAASRDLAWGTRSRVQTTRDLAWDVAGAPGRVGTTLATAWDVRAAVAATTATAWDIRTRVQATQDLTWDTRSRTGATLPVAWDAAARLLVDLDVGWAVLEQLDRVGAQRDLAWSVRARVRASAPASWDVEGAPVTTIEVSAGPLGRNLPLVATGSRGLLVDGPRR